MIRQLALSMHIHLEVTTKKLSAMHHAPGEGGSHRLACDPVASVDRAYPDCEFVWPVEMRCNVFNSYRTKGRNRDMKGKYGIPGHVLADLRRRDQNCVYCRVPMPDNRSDHPLNFATIEHIYPPGNDPTWVCWCCNGCNIRHQKSLREWFNSDYCIERDINENTVAPIIKAFLASSLRDADMIWTAGREDSLLKSGPWDPPAGDGQQTILRRTLTVMDQKAFDRILKRIRQCRYEFDFRGMEPGTFGRYYGFMYWRENDEALNRVPYPS